ncbi:MAG: restriction endonuclease subunit S, partial [Proteobacteria bacterium]
YEPSGIPYLQGKNIKAGRIDPTNLVTISKTFHEKQKKSQLRVGDILMVQSGHVGECAVVDEEFAGGNCHALIVMSPESRTSSLFFAQYFYAPQGLEKIASVKTGNTITHILATDLRAMTVCVPGLEEQQRIAEFLTSLGDLIAIGTQELDALKTHKKGLMQQLFPAAEAVEA